MRAAEAERWEVPAEAAGVRQEELRQEEQGAAVSL
jgi:hypothetical protein